MAETGEPLQPVSYEQRLQDLGDPHSDADIDSVSRTATLAFDEVLGLEGAALDVWNTTTLPQALEVYAGSNPTKLARKLLKVIDTAGALKGESAIAEYLKTAIPQDEVAFSRSDKEAHTCQLVQDIEEFIAENARQYGPDYQGVVAVVVWGSYARRQQRLESDIDFSTISRGDSTGFSDGDMWVSEADFEESLRERLKRNREHVPETENWSDYSLADEEGMRTIMELGTPEYIVASPFPEVKERVQRLLQEAVQTRASN